MNEPRTSEAGGPKMRLAYADPPYPGCAHIYRDHPDYAGEVDHRALLERLQNYDGWALSTSSKALQEIMALCPPSVRVLIWVKNTVRYAWEPVILQSARTPDPGLRDWIHVEAEAFQWRPKPEGYVTGQKPQPFSQWLFNWLGADPTDEFDDLFPGSGAVGKSWSRFSEQLRLPKQTTRISTNRAVRRALREHPRLEEAS